MTGGQAWMLGSPHDTGTAACAAPDTPELDAPCSDPFGALASACCVMLAC